MSVTTAPAPYAIRSHEAIALAGVPADTMGAPVVADPTDEQWEAVIAARDAEDTVPPEHPEPPADLPPYEALADIEPLTALVAAG